MVVPGTMLVFDKSFRTSGFPVWPLWLPNAC